MKNQRIEEKEIDLDIDLQPVESRVFRRTKLHEPSLNFWVLFSAIFCAGLLLFGIIKAYNKYEERKEAEEAIRYINEMTRQAERDLQRTLNSLSSPPVKQRPKEHIKPEKVKLEEEPGPKSGDFYQADDGTWRNY